MMKWVLAKSRSASPANATDPNSTVYGPRCERMVSVRELTVIDSDTGKTSVDHDLLPGDKTVGATRQKRHRACDLLFRTHAPHRHGCDCRSSLSVRQVSAREFGVYVSWCERVHEHIAFGVVQRKRAR